MCSNILVTALCLATTFSSDYDVMARSFSFSAIMNEDSTLLQWLKGLHQQLKHKPIFYLVFIVLEVDGLTLLHGMPNDRKALQDLICHVGFPLETHYGRYFEVEAKASPNNVAYTTKDLDLHLDLGYYEDNPGVMNEAGI